MANLPQASIRLADLPNRKPTRILLEPDAAERAAVADVLGIPAVKKLRFEARLTPRGKRDWSLAAELGATVVQDCVVTLAPVTTRIDEPVERNYLADLPGIEGGGEVELPEDETVEPLPETLDLAAVMIEALALALPPYPRAEGATVATPVFTEPGKAPLRDEDLKPFAGLAGLRERLDAGGKAPDGEAGGESTNPEDRGGGPAGDGGTRRDG